MASVLEKIHCQLNATAREHFLVAMTVKEEMREHDCKSFDCKKKMKRNCRSSVALCKHQVLFECYLRRKPSLQLLLAIIMHLTLHTY